jgi:coenzyme Q-binding protein COQ10
MRSHTEERELPYPVERVFDLVADVERYPLFVPGWRSVRILGRDGDTARVEQCIAVGPFDWRFVSESVFQRPERIRITASDGPFRHLRIEWLFTPRDGPRSLTRLSMTYEMRSQLVERAAALLLADLPRRTLHAFEDRLARLPPPTAEER